MSSHLKHFLLLLVSCWMSPKNLLFFLHLLLFCLIFKWLRSNNSKLRARIAFCGILVQWNQEWVSKLVGAVNICSKRHTEWKVVIITLLREMLLRRTHCAQAMPKKGQVDGYFDSRLLLLYLIFFFSTPLFLPIHLKNGCHFLCHFIVCFTAS